MSRCIWKMRFNEIERDTSKRVAARQIRLEDNTQKCRDRKEIGRPNSYMSLLFNGKHIARRTGKAKQANIYRRIQTKSRCLPYKLFICKQTQTDSRVLMDDSKQQDKWQTCVASSSRISLSNTSQQNLSNILDRFMTWPQVRKSCTCVCICVCACMCVWAMKVKRAFGNASSALDASFKLRTCCEYLPKQIIIVL